MYIVIYQLFDLNFYINLVSNTGKSYFCFPCMQLIIRLIRVNTTRLTLVSILWFLLASIAVLLELSRGEGSINNYLIFKGVFWHSLENVNLYALYPNEYFDANHYGPLFSILIAPFAILPNGLGCILWSLTNAWILWFAIMHLKISENNKFIILLICCVEMMTSTHNVQFNPMLAAWILLAYICIQNKNIFMATFFIVAGFYIKLYGIVGLMFFFFTPNKLDFIKYFIFWIVVLFCIPMLLSSPSFVYHSYIDWYHSLADKNALNVNSLASNFMQDISVMGMIRRIFSVGNFSNLIVLIPAAILIALPLLRIKNYQNKIYTLSYVAVVLISTVIFSTSAESATYIIALVGVAIWFIIQEKRNSIQYLLLFFVIILTSLSATDLFPKNLFNDYVRPYSLKALPCFIIWCILIVQLFTRKFSETKVEL